MRALGIVLGLLLVTAVAQAEERLMVCHDYGCQLDSEVVFTEARLAQVVAPLLITVDAENERKTLAGVIGQLYRWAGEQSAIASDRGGNYADAGVPGKMDCIDHSTTTTRLLMLLARRGWLRHHRVLSPVSRAWLGVIENHWSAQIEEVVSAAALDAPVIAPRFVVDSWFVDNGEPAVILPLEDWKKGAGPDV